MLSTCNLSLMKSLVHVLKSLDLIWIFFYVCVWNAYEDFWSLKSKCEVSGNLKEYMKFPLQTTEHRWLLCCWKTVKTHTGELGFLYVWNTTDLRWIQRYEVYCVICFYWLNVLFCGVVLTFLTKFFRLCKICVFY